MAVLKNNRNFPDKYRYTLLPATFSPVDLLDLFANFFHDKVQTIRDTLDNTISIDLSSP